MMPTRISFGGGVGEDCALAGRAAAMRSVRDAARGEIAFMLGGERLLFRRMGGAGTGWVIGTKKTPPWGRWRLTGERLLSWRLRLYLQQVLQSLFLHFAQVSQDLQHLLQDLSDAGAAANAEPRVRAASVIAVMKVFIFSVS